MELKTLKDARLHLYNNLGKGVTCPICAQTAKVYRRPIYGAMVKCLRELERVSPFDFIHLNDLKLQSPEFTANYHGGHFSNFMRFGIIEPKVSGSNQNRSGIWKITQLGKEFLSGILLVPKCVYTYNNETIHVSDILVSVADVMAEEFDLRDALRDESANIRHVLQKDHSGDEISIADARAKVGENKLLGTTCPCCERKVKTYKLPLSGQMVTCLSELHRIAKQEYAHISDLNAQSPLFLINYQGGSFARLAHFNLIQEMPKDPSNKNKKTSGAWRVTNLGVQFLAGNVKVPKFFLRFNQECIGLSEDTISVDEAKSVKFDLQESCSIPDNLKITGDQLKVAQDLYG